MKINVLFFLGVTFGIPLASVPFKNNTGTQFTLLSGKKCIVIDDDRGGFIELQDGNKFIAVNGNKKQLFDLAADEKDVELIVLQIDYNHNLYALVQGYEGKPDYKEEPKIIP